MRRRSLDGFWDRKQPWGGPVTGSGPNFQKALAAFEKRQRRQGEVGKWRCAPAKWKKNSGSYIDRDWALIDY